MSRFLVKSLEHLQAYTPGHQPKAGSMIKLNTNENPYPPPRGVADVVAEKVNVLHLYNDPSCQELTTVFSDVYQVSKNQVLFANGSDEILAFCFLAFCEPEQGVCFPEISYGFYEVFSDLFRVPSEKIPLSNDLSIPYQKYFGKNKTIIIANPNAPTSLFLGLDKIEEILKHNKNNIVIIDEAYVDFGGESARTLLGDYGNLVVTGTFSKSRNLAGARLGYVLASEELIADLNRIKFSFNPYNVNTLTQALGVASLKDDTYFKECCSNIVETRSSFTKNLEDMGFHVLESKANFVFTMHPHLSGEVLMEGLLERNILVRHFKHPQIENYLRITIGTREDMDILTKNLQEMVEKLNAKK